MRYLAAGVSEKNLLRTDRGDNENGQYGDDEWEDSNTPSKYFEDKAGDDDVLVTLKNDGSKPSVGYRQTHRASCR